MGAVSSIEWTEAGWPPIRARNKATGKVGWHCEHVTSGCEHCYSESINKRLGTGLPFKPGHRGDIEIFLDETMLLAPLRWKRPRRIFVCSMTDLFADFVSDEWIDRVFAVMALAPQHTFQVLTKRSARMRIYIDDDWTVNRVGEQMFDISPLDRSALNWPLPNVWLGVSAEDQRRADERVPDLLATPAAVRFVSAEPLLGPIDFRALDLKHEKWVNLKLDALTGAHSGIVAAPPYKPGFELGPSLPQKLPGLDWIIVGGESGPGARPMHPDWAASIRDQCSNAFCPFFFKQWGAWKNGSDFAPDAKAVLRDGRVMEPTQEAMRRADRDSPVPPHRPTMMRLVGKKAAGRELDGRTHDAMPVTP